MKYLVCNLTCFLKFSVDHKSHNQNHTKNSSKDHIHFTFLQDDLLQLKRIIDLQHSRECNVIAISCDEIPNAI